MNVSVEQVMAWHPREGFTRERILALTKGRTELPVESVSLLPLAPSDLLWVLLRPELIDAVKLRTLCADLAAHVLDVFETGRDEKAPRQAIDAARAFAAGAIGKSQLAEARQSAREVAESVKGPSHHAAMAAALAAAEDMTAFVAEGCAQAASDAAEPEVDERSWQLATVREALGVEIAPEKPLEGTISVRLAQDADGPAIGALVARNGFYFEDFSLDWASVYPYWVVADVAGCLAGAIQVCPGKPIGRLELLCTEPRLTKRHKAKVVLALTNAGQAALLAQGCQVASGVIPVVMKGYKQIARRRGWRVACTGNLMAKRLK